MNTCDKRFVLLNVNVGLGRKAIAGTFNLQEHLIYLLSVHFLRDSFVSQDRVDIERVEQNWVNLRSARLA